MMPDPFLALKPKGKVCGNKHWVKLVRLQETYASAATAFFAHQHDQSFCPYTPSFSLRLLEKGLEGSTYGISIEERPTGHPKSIEWLRSLLRDG